MTTSTDFSPALLHLLRLVSPALPVGAYAYSQGLESAVEHRWVQDINGAEQWLRGALTISMAYLDAPVFLRLYKGWKHNKAEEVTRWNNLLQASRETSELLLEDTQMGAALLRLLKDLEVPQAQSGLDQQAVSYATAFTLAAHHWKLEPQPALRGFLWSWLENQIAAAIKLIPLGQTQGQQLLLRLLSDVDETAIKALSLTDDDIGWSLPRIALASMQHETQYSRLFRS